MTTLVVFFITSPLNSSWLDVGFQWLGMILCALLLCLLKFSKAAYKLHVLRLFLAFSFAVTIVLAYMLKHAPNTEYAHMYWIAQSLSYLIEVALCIELAKHVIVNNWFLTAIFAPVVSAVTALTFIVYGIPKGLSDITRPAYINTLICGFILLMVWLLEGKFEGKLQQPYSGITFVFSCYLAVRLCITYIHSYYGASHREIISRLGPINEDLLLIGWLSVLLYYFPNANINSYDQKTPILQP